MSIEGIWTTEVYGAFGWENRGVYLLENGRMIGGDNRQYSMGTYSVSGDQVTAELKVYYYGPPPTIFGEEREEYTIKLDGKLEDDAIDGKVHRQATARTAVPVDYAHGSTSRVNEVNGLTRRTATLLLPHQNSPNVGLGSESDLLSPFPKRLLLRSKQT